MAKALADKVGEVYSNRLTIDLGAQTITHDASGAVIRFEIEATRKEALMSGLDPRRDPTVRRRYSCLRGPPQAGKSVVFNKA